MKSNMFRELKETEKRAKLLAVLLRETKGFLSKKELEDIVNNIDINIQYKINILDDYDEYSKIITLSDRRDEHSWAGGDGDVEKGEVLLGEIEFGLNYYYQFSNNGNLEPEEENYIMPNFDITKKSAVLIEHHSWDYWESHNGNYDDYEYSINIYLPKGIQKEKDKEIEKILSLFDIK